MTELERVSELIFSNPCLFHFTDEGAKVQRRKETHSRWDSWVYPVSPPWPGTIPGNLTVCPHAPVPQPGWKVISPWAPHMSHYSSVNVWVGSCRVLSSWLIPPARALADHQAGWSSQWALPWIMASVSLLRMSSQTLEKVRLGVCPVNFLFSLET